MKEGKENKNVRDTKKKKALKNGTNEFRPKRKKLCFNKAFTTIRFKLFLSFMIPIIFIIILGVVSFLYASNSVISSYEKSTTQAINM